MPLAAEDAAVKELPTTTHAKRAIDDADLPEAKRTKVDAQKQDKENQYGKVDTREKTSDVKKTDDEERKKTHDSSRDTNDVHQSKAENSPPDQHVHDHRPHFQEAAANVVTALRVLAAATLDHTKHVASDVTEQLKQTARKGSELSTAALHKSTEATSHAVGSLANGAAATGEMLRDISSHQTVELTRDQLPSFSEVKESAASTLAAIRDQISHGAGIASEKLAAVGSVALETAANIGDMMLVDDRRGDQEAEAQ